MKSPLSYGKALGNGQSKVPLHFFVSIEAFKIGKGRETDRSPEKVECSGCNRYIHFIMYFTKRK
jgi:hypothetical protein